MKIRAPHCDDWIYAALIVCFALVAWIGEFGFVRSLEWKTLDWRTQIRADEKQPPPDERLLFIGIEDHSTKNIERKRPFYRVADVIDDPAVGFQLRGVRFAFSTSWLVIPGSRRSMSLR